jgi:tRNA (guanine26-N2/guanine27-N2)-dimethyltransferase
VRTAKAAEKGLIINIFNVYIGVFIYKEGNTVIKYFENAFLNPKSRLTRDMGVAFLNAIFSKTDKEKLNVLDPTAATGIRGIRYVKETGIKNITFLEINKNAYKVLRKNLNFCKISANAFNTSIQEFANTLREKFDIIDLDPFGSIAPNLYDILKLAKDKTYLFITATDTAVLCGAHTNACYKIYDAKPMHNELSHEVGLRIMLGFVAKTAAQFNFGIDVIFAFSYAHYFRALVKLNHGSDNAIASLKNLGYVYYCNKCGYRNISKSFLPTQQKCKCGSMLEISGRLWADTLIKEDILKKVAENIKKIPDISNNEIKFIDTITNEKTIPLYYSIPKLTKLFRISSIKLSDLIEKLRQEGFAVSRTHFDLTAIKTDAPIEEITKIILNLNHASTNLKNSKV